MATTSPKVPPIPAPDVPVIDAAGRITVPWYAFFKQIENILRQVRSEIP